MNFAIDRCLPDEQVTEIPTALARWYAAQSSIRRLRAIEYRDMLIVFVALEPTSDGNDTLPVWLAKQHDWTNDLRSLANRAVQLELIAPGISEASYAHSETAVIAELSWRDFWTS